MWIRKAYPTHNMIVIKRYTQYKAATTVAFSAADPECLSRIRVFSIPDPIFIHPESRICIKEFKYFNPKKWFLCSQWSGLFIPDPDPGSGFFTHPGSRIHGSKRHRIQDLNPQHWLLYVDLTCSCGGVLLECFNWLLWALATPAVRKSTQVKDLIKLWK